MTSLMANSIPDASPGSTTAYHYLSFGWILDGVVQRVAGMSLKDYVQANIANKLGLERSLLVGTSSTDNLASLGLKKLLVSRPENTDESSTAGASGRRPVTSPSLLMNPTFFNNLRVRAASIPAANGHFSARGLATFYNALLPHATEGAHLMQSNGGLSLHYDNLTTASASHNDRMLQGEIGSIKLGFMTFPTPQQKQEASASVAFGHTGLGGSVAFCDPSDGNNLVVAITVNRLAFDARTTRAIIRKIYAGLKLPIPAQFDVA